MAARNEAADRHIIRQASTITSSERSVSSTSPLGSDGGVGPALLREGIRRSKLPLARGPSVVASE